ncbi:hypothetical protein CcCBS67573_g10096 [Chytriomyces confervae]|uniref:Tc1-like transposase DDE domain-containing protein n=1 Tax=Chytriomyces confervae TaxID=246404 RepID=A0A507DGD4_9FUNG|nr:hypothetical protein CcCBS67573_g10096 [Chytriomyces confervae]
MLNLDSASGLLGNHLAFAQITCIPTTWSGIDGGRITSAVPVVYTTPPIEHTLYATHNLLSVNYILTKNKYSVLFDHSNMSASIGLSMGRIVHPDALLWCIIYAITDGDKFDEDVGYIQSIQYGQESIHQYRWLFQNCGQSKVGGKHFELLIYLSGSHHQHLQALLQIRKDLYLEELVKEMEMATGQKVSIATMWQCLRRLRLTKKAVECNEHERLKFLLFIGQFEAEQLVFADESAVNRKTLERNWGWNYVGRRAAHHAPFVRGKKHSVVAAISLDGYVSFSVIDGSLDSITFMSWLEEDLLPNMNPFPGTNGVLVLDNAAIHKHPSVLELCKKVGVLLIFLPPYSPDYNLIEQSFFLAKSYLCHHKERLIHERQEDAIYEACMTIQAERVLSCFRTCNYV